MTANEEGVPRGTRAHPPAMSRPAPRALPTRRARLATRGGAGVVAAFGAGAGWADERLRELALEAIDANPRQPRRRFDRVSLERLTDSVRERGVLQPVLVRPAAEGRYELIAGERRWRAAKLAGLERLPAFIRSDTADEVALELALTENVCREELSPVEEARTLSLLIDDLGITKQALAKRLGRSRPQVANTIRLLDLPGEVLDLLDAGQLTKAHGKALLCEPDHHRRATLARTAAAEQWSTRQLERAIAAHAALHEDPSPADVDPAVAASTRELADQLATALGAGVRIRPRGEGIEVHLTYPSLQDVRDLAAAVALPGR